jgi:hypothetical protein
MEQAIVSLRLTGTAPRIVLGRHTLPGEIVKCTRRQEQALRQQLPGALERVWPLEDKSIEAGADAGGQSYMQVGNLYWPADVSIDIGETARLPEIVPLPDSSDVTADWDRVEMPGNDSTVGVSSEEGTTPAPPAKPAVVTAADLLKDKPKPRRSRVKSSNEP